MINLFWLFIYTATINFYNKFKKAYLKRPKQNSEVQIKCINCAKLSLSI